MALSMVRNLLASYQRHVWEDEVTGEPEGWTEDLQLAQDCQQLLADIRQGILETQAVVYAGDLLSIIEDAPGDLEISRQEIYKHLAFEALLTDELVLFGGIQETEESIIYKAVSRRRKDECTNYVI